MASPTVRRTVKMSDEIFPSRWDSNDDSEQRDQSIELNRLLTFPVGLNNVNWRCLANYGMYFCLNQLRLACAFCTFSVAARDIMNPDDTFDMDQLIASHGPECRESACLKNIPLGRLSDILNFKHEADRFYSMMKKDWMDTRMLATFVKNGFYYTGAGDVMRCAFCAAEIANWQPWPAGEMFQTKHNADCQFVLDRYGSGNVRIGDELYGSLNGRRVRLPTCEPLHHQDEAPQEAPVEVLQEALALQPLEELPLGAAIEVPQEEAPQGAPQPTENGPFAPAQLETLCKRCSVAPINMVCCPCGHMTLCNSCTDNEDKCRDCLEDINAFIKAEFVSLNMSRALLHQI